VNTEFREFVGKYFRFPSPPGVSRLQAVGGVGGAQLS
jgi:hypothetical protein